MFYQQKGAVKLSVLAKNGREAVVAILDAGNFFGEGCLTGQPLRMGNATAASASVVMRIEKEPMLRLRHTERTFSDRFITHMLARTLLLVARDGKADRCGWCRDCHRRRWPK